jgi:hypothetical protein
MIFDEQTLLSNQQAITATAASTNVIDLGATGTVIGAAGALPRDIGKGVRIPLRVQVTEAFNNLTSLQVALQVAAASDFASSKTVKSITVPVADLKAGKVVEIDYVPRGTDQRYLRLNYTVTGTAPTAGKVTAGIVAGHQESYGE